MLNMVLEEQDPWHEEYIRYCDNDAKFRHICKYEKSLSVKKKQYDDNDNEDIIDGHGVYK